MGYNILIWVEGSDKEFWVYIMQLCNTFEWSTGKYLTNFLGIHTRSYTKKITTLGWNTGEIATAFPSSVCCIFYGKGKIVRYNIF